MQEFRIGTLADKTQTSVAAIRYYEAEGLLRAAPRSDSGQRRYGDADVERLQFIRRCREFGFALDDVKRVLALRDDAACSCEPLRDIGQRQLTAITERLAEMTALAAQLSAIVARCDATCRGGPASGCSIVVDLGR